MVKFLPPMRDKDRAAAAAPKVTGALSSSEEYYKVLNRCVSAVTCATYERYDTCVRTYARACTHIHVRERASEHRTSL